jgi:Flp pilus assembly protein CpaB
VKLKNLFLLTAVIGCGLFVTILKTSKSGQLAIAEQEQQVILVAAKDLPIGTWIDKDKVAELTKKKKVNKADAPLDAYLDEDELIGKVVTTNLRADDYFMLSSLSPISHACIAPEKQLYVINLPYECVGPWVLPGKKVDVVCTHRPPGASVVRLVRILHQMPVVAVDYCDKPTRAMDCGPLFCSVTLVASLEEAHWMQMAKDSGTLIRFLIDDGCGKFTKPSDDEMYELFKGIAKETKNRQAKE